MLILQIIRIYFLITVFVDGIFIIALTSEYEEIRFPTPKVLREYCSIFGVIFLTICIIILAPIPYFIRTLLKNKEG